MIPSAVHRMHNALLLVALLLLLGVEPFLAASEAMLRLFDAIVSAVLIAAVWTVSRSRRLLVIGLVLVTPVLAGRWLVYFVDFQPLAILGLVSGIAFFTFAAAVVLRQALTGAQVTADTIAGAICVYLMLAVVAALAFSLLEITHPGSFLVDGHRIGSADPSGRTLFVQQLLYLSLITVSTVGYGDILPATPPARMLAALEAVVGQLYLAVLIARLVGLHVPRSGRDA